MIPIKYKPEIKSGEEGRVSKDYEEPNDQLVDSFFDYLQESRVGFHSDNYQLAEDLLEDINFTIPKMNSLFLLFNDSDKIKTAGSFLSAAYNRSETEDIEYEIETEIQTDGIGFVLNEDKNLILKSDSGRMTSFRSQGLVKNLAESIELGKEAQGIIINQGEVTSSFARDFKGVAVNLGQVSGSFGTHATGVCINYGQVDRYFGLESPDGVFVSTQELEGKNEDLDQESNFFVPEAGVEAEDSLSEYLEKIKEIFEKDPKQIRLEFPQDFSQATFELEKEILDKK